jgi:hypothetical protein
MPTTPVRNTRRLPGTHLFRVLSFFLLLAGLAPAPRAETTTAATEPGQPALGWYVPSANLRLGGYATLRFRDLRHESSRLDIRDLSLFATWTPAEYWLVFSEVEIEEGLTLDGNGLSTRDGELAIERLYVEHAATSWLTLRLGKFLTPVGRWNELHADPLVATISRPLVTSLPFASNASGAAARGSIQIGNGNLLDYIVYLDWSSALSPDRDDTGFEDLEIPDRTNAFDNAVGAQVRYHLWSDHLEFGLSVADVRIHDEPRRGQIFGLDGRAQLGALELSSEFVYRRNHGVEADEIGGYIQGLYPANSRWAGVLRWEHYDGRFPAESVTLETAGVVFRPYSPLLLKLEYRNGDDNTDVADSGLLASISLLF